MANELNEKGESFIRLLEEDKELAEKIKTLIARREDIVGIKEEFDLSLLKEGKLTGDRCLDAIIVLSPFQEIYSRYNYLVGLREYMNKEKGLFIYDDTAYGMIDRRRYHPNIILGNFVNPNIEAVFLDKSSSEVECEWRREKFTIPFDAKIVVSGYETILSINSEGEVESPKDRVLDITKRFKYDNLRNEDESDLSGLIGFHFASQFREYFSALQSFIAKPNNSPDCDFANKVYQILKTNINLGK